MHSGAFIGYCGLVWAPSSVPGSAVELRWGVACEQWGQGLCSRRHAVVLQHAFVTLQLPEVVACMAQINEPAKQLVAELGMRADQAASRPPGAGSGHLLREQLLYGAAGDWRQ